MPLDELPSTTRITPSRRGERLAPVRCSRRPAPTRRRAILIALTLLALTTAAAVVATARAYAIRANRPVAQADGR